MQLAICETLKIFLGSPLLQPLQCCERNYNSVSIVCFHLITSSPLPISGHANSCSDCWYNVPYVLKDTHKFKCAMCLLAFTIQQPLNWCLSGCRQHRLPWLKLLVVWTWHALHSNWRHIARAQLVGMSSLNFQTSNYPLSSVSVAMDASQLGWVATWSQHSISGIWQWGCQDRINFLGLHAMFFAVWDWPTCFVVWRQ